MVSWDAFDMAFDFDESYVISLDELGYLECKLGVCRVGGFGEEICKCELGVCEEEYVVCGVYKEEVLKEFDTNAYCIEFAIVIGLVTEALMVFEGVMLVVDEDSYSS